MAARAIWTGHIQFGTVDVPVKLYSAVQDRSIHFRLLDAKRHEPVKQHMIDPTTGDVVESAAIRKAYEVQKGKLVILDAEELEEVQPEAAREIEITRFVPDAQITHQWYDRPYWLGPDGSGKSAYFALAKALADEKLEGVARWVMRKKQYVGALRAEGDYLMLIALRHADEVVPASALTPPGGRALGEKEVAMAKQLVQAMAGELDVADFRDEYRDRVLEYVEAKAKGRVKKLPRAKAKRTDDDDISDILERSLAAAGGEAGGTKRRRKSA